MKVCILTTSFPRFPGDYASVFVYDLAAELVAAGMEVCVIAPIEAGSLYHEVIRGVEVHRFAYFWPVRWQRIAYLGGIPDNLRRYRAAWLQLPFFLLSFFITAVKEGHDCELFHAHWVFSGLVALALRLAPKPIVLTVHGSDLNVSSGNKLLRFLRQFVVMRVDKVIAVSTSLANKLRELNLPEERIAPIGNGVNLAVFGERCMETAPGYRLVWVGRMSPVKGLIYLLKALPDILKVFPETTLMLIGDGPLRRELEDMAEDLNVKSALHFVGFADHESVAEYLAEADLFILPSLSEGLPLAVLEAMSTGLPVVATAVGGVSELVVTESPEATGLLVPAADSVALGEDVVYIFGHPDEARQWAITAVYE
ncbi:MAG: glycosyltransferase [Chloroflexi bacterium]|nr:glycosyltransferase [Chloroflexota bacterium]